MGDELKRGAPDIGHSSTTIPGGEKDLPGDSSRTPGKAGGNDDAGEDDQVRNEGRGEKTK